MDVGMLPIVIATSNRHKLVELRTLLAIEGICWYSLSDFPGLPPIKERGRTFDANATTKARTVARYTGMLALADDSGLEVDALGGKPGVLSARFCGRHGDDQANNVTLLSSLDAVPLSHRRARYRCCLALASPSRLIALTQGLWEGLIALRPAGRGGFGYDPLFFIPRFGKTVGQMPARVKRRFSHRAFAARGMRPVLRQILRHSKDSCQNRPGPDQNHSLSNAIGLSLNCGFGSLIVPVSR